MDYHIIRFHPSVETSQCLLPELSFNICVKIEGSLMDTFSTDGEPFPSLRLQLRSSQQNTEFELQFVRHNIRNF